MDWVKDEDYEYEDYESRYTYGDWTIYVYDRGTELWQLWHFCGMFESQEDAMHYVKRVEES